MIASSKNGAEVGMGELDKQVRNFVAAGDVGSATTLVLRELGSELLGFLSGVLPDADADDVFSELSERLWKSLSGFEGRCSIRTWAYVLARHELGRYRQGVRRHADRRVPISEFKDIIAFVRTKTRSTLATHNQRRLTALRDALPIDDRTLLILRVDRDLSWNEIALAFADSPETLSAEDRKREAARLRKRFQLLKRRLVAQAREAQLNLAVTAFDAQDRA
jgi:RNA polymerase sigma-70 factor, ECF subfamily